MVCEMDVTCQVAEIMPRGVVERREVVTHTIHAESEVDACRR